MVVINTQEGIQIKHVIDIRNTSYFIATICERSTNRTKCYLFNSEQGTIYSHNGRWNRIEDPYTEKELHTLIREAIRSSDVPQYSTSQTSGIIG